MNHSITAAKIVLVADRRQASASTPQLRRYRLARLSPDQHAAGRAPSASARPV
jgi:hypothetical protein